MNYAFILVFLVILAILGVAKQAPQTAAAVGDTICTLEGHAMEVDFGKIRARSDKDYLCQRRQDATHR